MCETQAGKGALPYDHPQELGAVGATGTPGANILAREADLMIGIGTRYSDFTTASKTAFQNPSVRFININVSRVRRLQACRYCAHRRRTCDDQELQQAVAGYKVDGSYQARDCRLSE